MTPELVIRSRRPIQRSVHVIFNTREADMKRTLLALAVAALGIVTWPAPDLFAQTAAHDTNRTRGTITALGRDSITIKVRDNEMKFDVTSATVVEAKGAGTKGRAAQAEGKSGPMLSDVVKAGEAVEISYVETESGALRATRIRRVPGAGASSASAASEAKPNEMISTGVVKAVTDGSMTISGSAGGGAKFTQSFMVDHTTKVIAKGAGTAAAATGGKLALTKAVSEGDRVRVSYHEAGTSLQASQVLVTLKAAARPKT
jgi:hypothetical protein